MKILSIFKHGTGPGIQKRSPGGMRYFMLLPFLGRIREYAVLILRPYLTIYRLRGQSQGGILTLTYAVSGADTDLKLFF